MTSPEQRRPPLHDLWPRLLLSPVFGVAIPNLAGMIDNSRHSTTSLVASYACFTAVAFAIWEGNRRLYFRFRDPDGWLRRPWQRLRVLFGTVLLYTVPFSIAMLGGWGVVTGEPAATLRAIAMAVLLIVLTTLTIVHVYETVFLVHDWESDRLRNERLQRLALESELEALKSQVDPHVLFNSLNTLSHLVESGSSSTGTFVQALARSYRYLIETRRRRVVTLGEELALLDQFSALAAIRFSNALRVEVMVSKSDAERFLLPPVTLPELLQNAVKHNDLTLDAPFIVDVRIDESSLVVSNTLRRRSDLAVSTGAGLANLSDRYRLTMGSAIQWGEENGHFVVRLPLAHVEQAVSDRRQIASRA